MNAAPDSEPFANLAQSVAAVKALLDQGLLDPAALGLARPTPTPSGVPGTRVTVAELAEGLEKSFLTDTRRTYMPYIRFLRDGWAGHEDTFAGYGAMWADEILPSHLEIALKHVEARAREQIDERNEIREDLGRAVRTSSNTTAAYNAVGAWRRLFKYAVDNRHLAAELNPAQKIDKPKRVDGTRVALTQQQYDQLWELVDSTGDDPQLDRMLCETIVISGARVEGLLNLSLGGIDLEECTVRLDEKFGDVVNQPVPDWWIVRLREFAVSRGAARSGDPVFVKRAVGRRPATPITDRRFDNLFTSRLQSAYEWADKQQVGAHTLRHHGITVIERHAGKAVARAFARHKPGDVNDVYTAATRQEVAQAVIDLYTGDHPWLHREPRTAR